MNEGDKKNKDFVISARYTEDEYMDVLLKITDEDGHRMMSPGAFSKAAALAGKVTIVDSELEQYRAFIAGNIGNNLNQIARRLNTDNLAGTITEQTYIDVLNELGSLKKELTKLLEPLR